MVGGVWRARLATRSMAEAADALVIHDCDFIDEADLIEASKSLAEISKSLSIFVIGSTGVGKSSLVALLLDPERELPAVEKLVVKPGMLPVTTKTEAYRALVDDVSIVIYDTKGMFDVSGGDYENETIERVEEVCNNDCTTSNGVLLICIEMYQRIDVSTMERMLTLLHRKCGRKIWEVTVIALTKADQYPESEWLWSKKWYQSSQKILREKFEEALCDARQYLRSLFTSATVGLSEEEFDKLEIPILPTSQLTIDAMSRMEKVGYVSWFDMLQTQCRTRVHGAAPVKIHLKRLSIKHTK